MNLAEYKRAHRGQSVTKDVRDRWAGRVAANQWDQLGRLGAEEYLSRYGRNIGSKKLIKFAIHAYTRGFPAFGDRMWEKAFEIDHPGLPFHTMDTVDPESSAAGLPDIFHT